MTIENTQNREVKITASNNSAPLVSICCATYNHEKFIEVAIESFLMQEVDFPFEIIIHDDASTDKTPEIIKEYAQKYPDLIRPIFQDENQFRQGKRIMISCLIPHAIGKYIALCEGDDYWIDPKKLNKQISFLESNSRYVGCFTDFRTVNDDNEIVKDSNFKNMKSEFNHADILSSQTPKTLTTVFRREFVPGEFPSEIKSGLNGDLILASLVSIHGPYKYINFVSGAYRIHNNGVWSLIGSESQFLNQMNTSRALMSYFNSTEQIRVLRLRFKTSSERLLKLYIREKSIFKFFRYSIYTIGLMIRFWNFQIFSRNRYN